MKRLARPRSWAAFQHYKNRRPPWIKLHRGLLDDRDYQRLPLASRALAPMLWLLASESDDGCLDVGLEELSFRLRQPESEIAAGLQPLIDAGFLELVHTASAALATCLRPATPEREADREVEIGTEGGPGPRAIPVQAKSALPAKARRAKSPELRFADWLAQVRAAGQKPISDSPVWAYALRVGLPEEFVWLAWARFKTRYASDPRYVAKTYSDWRAVFRNAVAEDWFRLWRPSKAGGFELTTAGEQARREVDAAQEAPA
jgi:hypothetical protein